MNTSPTRLAPSFESDDCHLEDALHELDALCDQMNLATLQWGSVRRLREASVLMLLAHLPLLDLRRSLGLRPGKLLAPNVRGPQVLLLAWILAGLAAWGYV